MPLTGSLMFVYICIDVGDPVEGGCWDAVNGIPTPPRYWIADIYRQTLDYLLMASQHLPSTESPTSIHI
jgi:hypothetical protein